MGNELQKMVNSLFDQIDNKKNSVSGNRAEHLETLESEASILASVATDLEKRAKERPEQKEAIYQDFQKTINELKETISVI